MTDPTPVQPAPTEERWHLECQNAQCGHRRSVHVNDGGYCVLCIQQQPKQYRCTEFTPEEPVQLAAGQDREALDDIIHIAQLAVMDVDDEGVPRFNREWADEARSAAVKQLQGREEAARREAVDNLFGPVKDRTLVADLLVWLAGR